MSITKKLDALYRWYGTKEDALKIADKLSALWIYHSDEYTSAPLFVIAKNKNGYYVKKIQKLTLTGEEYAETITRYYGSQALAL